MTNRYILIVYGPMCAGKTSAVKHFLAQQPHVCHIALDKIKRLISDYSPEKYAGMLNELAFGLAESAVQKGLSLVVEGNVGLQNQKREMYQELAKSHGLGFYEVTIEAPLPILTERFLNRVALATEKGSKVSVTTVEGMMQRYQGYLQYKKDHIPLIDSALHTSEQIAAIMIDLITK